MGRGATKVFCGCMLGVYESRLKQNELAALEAEMKISGSMPQQLQETVRIGLNQCRP
jgi:hypothetical protein